MPKEQHRVKYEAISVPQGVSDLSPLLRSCTFESFYFSVIGCFLKSSKKIEQSLKAGRIVALASKCIFIAELKQRLINESKSHIKLAMEIDNSLMASFY
ncbi:UNVERIFIED_CONTAM: hypothetical protein NCL1_11498 [Trichonephila clavipes]